MVTFQRCAWVVLCVLCAACTSKRSTGIGKGEVGEGCDQTAECKAGLLCEAGYCAPLASDTQIASLRGKACTQDSDCGAVSSVPNRFCDDGVFSCNAQGVCSECPYATLNMGCGLDVDCAKGLICHGEKRSCQPPPNASETDDTLLRGTRGLGEKCLAPTDCRRPYVCGLGETCVKPPFFAPSDCSASDMDFGSFRGYFDIPPFDANQIPAGVDFYRLPFPSDIRMRNGHIDLQNHATPGNVLGVDIKKLYVENTSEDASGYATNQPIFFRFSDAFDLRTLCLTPQSVYPEVTPEDQELDDNYNPRITQICPHARDGSQPTVLLVDLADNTTVPVELAYDRDRNNYICQHWIGIIPDIGHALKQGHTYAAIVTTGLKSYQGLDYPGDTPVKDEDLEYVLQDAQPLDSDLAEKKHAWHAMEPLRVWLNRSDALVRKENIANATVFTTGRFNQRVEKLRTSVESNVDSVGFNSGFVECTANNVPIFSKCDDPLPLAKVPFSAGGTRNCKAHANTMRVFHGTYQSPQYQKGTLPFNQPVNQNGEISWNTAGLSEKVTMEERCYALAVPSGPTPSGGWPVVVYGHGTNGHFSDFLSTQGGSQAMVDALIDAGFAVFSFDNVSHGYRQGSPWNGDPITPDQAALKTREEIIEAYRWREPGTLFFNIKNPRASKNHVYQGGMDLHAVVALLKKTPFNLPSGVSFDGNGLYYIGHSQGSVIGIPFLASMEDGDIKAAVLSGSGAELGASILKKEKPFALSAALTAFFGDRNIQRVHPMMGLLSVAFAEVEAVNEAALVRAQNIPLLQFNGKNDKYSPDISQLAWISAMQLPYVEDTPLDGLSVKGVLRFEQQDASLDGHMVMFGTQGVLSLKAFLHSVKTATPSVRKVSVP